MRSQLFVALLFAFQFPGAAHAAPPAEGDAGNSNAASNLLAAAAAAKEGDCERTVGFAVKVVDSENAASLPEEARAAALELAATCEAQLGRSADAYRHAVAATKLAASDESAWELRLVLELREQRSAAAIATIEAMAKERSAALNAIPIRWFYQFDMQLKNAGATGLRRRLLAILADGGYVPDEPGVTVDGFRQRYAEILYDSGERGTATELIRRIEHPSTLLEISLDQRFRTLLPTNFDLRQSVEQALQRAREVAELNPDRIAPVNDVALYLRVLGKPRESLAALESLRTRIGDDAAFEDADEYIVWWWDSISRGHQMLGEYAPAVDALRKGGALAEDGGLNVSQIINLSQVQLAFGHPEEALATLRMFDESNRGVSPYGTMQIVVTRGCAKAQLGKPSEAGAEATFARAHQKDAPKALTSLLLCIGDVGGAAESLIERLGNPDQRVAALRELSDYDEPPAPLPPDPFQAHLEAVKARADVQSAIQRAGGTRRFHVQNIMF